MAADLSKRKFVPTTLDTGDFSQLEPLYELLLNREILSVDDLKTWLLDFSELESVIDETRSRRYIDKSCHTDDEAIQKAYMHFVETVDPQTKPYFFKLQKKLLDSQYLAGLGDTKYRMLARRWQADVDIFCDENIPLEVEVTKLSNEYDKTSGAMMVFYRDREYTLQQLARFIEEPDRAVRQEAWELSTRRRMKDRHTIDDIFEKLLPLRDKIASNANVSDYRAFCWKAYKRFDYTPEDCLDFADAIAETCVPLVKELDRQRAKDLGISRLRPWDLAVDPQNRPPLRPFKETEVDGFVAKTKSIFDRLSPELGLEFDSLRINSNLDLASRKGKQPGGYQCSLEESRQPFIFMNAAGLQRDLETLLHEAGHAFHYLAAKDEPLVFLRSAPMEFCEVASMAMELFGDEHLDVFYNDAEAARAKRVHLEGIIRFFPWMATIDTFQHWLYTHPGHTLGDRTAAWIGILDRFGGEVDWSGYTDAREAMWQRQLHLFHHPFYYIEYGIAQLGALQLWMKAKEDPRRALANYRNGLRLAGTKPLPDLFNAAGIQFDFSKKTLAPLMQAIQRDLNDLPR